MNIADLLGHETRRIDKRIILQCEKCKHKIPIYIDCHRNYGKKVAGFIKCELCGDVFTYEIEIPMPKM